MIFSASLSSAASMMTLLMAPDSWQASLTRAMSLRTRSWSPLLSAPMLMTMSISRAPSRTARRASKAFTSEGVAPKGKPMTEATATSVSRSRTAARRTQVGLTQTEAKWCSAASSQSLSMSAAEASGLSSVWSM